MESKVEENTTTNQAPEDTSQVNEKENTNENVTEKEPEKNGTDDPAPAPAPAEAPTQAPVPAKNGPAAPPKPATKQASCSPPKAPVANGLAVANNKINCKKEADKTRATVLDVVKVSAYYPCSRTSICIQ